jgi:hypothetical protein
VPPSSFHAPCWHFHAAGHGTPLPASCQALPAQALPGGQASSFGFQVFAWCCFDFVMVTQLYFVMVTKTWAQAKNAARGWVPREGPFALKFVNVRSGPAKVKA